MFKKLYHIALRECGIMWKNPIYLFCMVIFPIVVVIFFTTLMKGGVPTDMPVGIVDQDNSATSRQLVHKLDAFQTTKVVAHYENMAEARHAIQKNEIYAFLLIPDGTEAGLMAQKQPKISFYYSSVSLAAGSLLFRDLKTISTLGGAAAGMAKLSALGKTNDEIMTFLPAAYRRRSAHDRQPIRQLQLLSFERNGAGTHHAVHLPDYTLFYRYGTEVQPSKRLDADGRQQSLSRHCG